MKLPEQDRRQWPSVLQFLAAIVSLSICVSCAPTGNTVGPDVAAERTPEGPIDNCRFGGRQSLCIVNAGDCGDGLMVYHLESRCLEKKKRPNPVSGEVRDPQGKFHPFTISFEETQKLGCADDGVGLNRPFKIQWAARDEKWGPGNKEDAREYLRTFTERRNTYYMNIHGFRKIYVRYKWRNFESDMTIGPGSAQNLPEPPAEILSVRFDREVNPACWPLD